MGSCTLLYIPLFHPPYKMFIALLLMLIVCHINIMFIYLYIVYNVMLCYGCMSLIPVAPLAGQENGELTWENHCHLLV